MPSPRRCVRLAVCLSFLLLGSCATMRLWGQQWRPRLDRTTGADEGEYEPVFGTRWEWWRVALRVVATPATLAVDLVAALPEALLEGAADDAEGADERRVVHSYGDGFYATPSLPPQPQPGAAKPWLRSGKPMLSGVRR